MSHLLVTISDDHPLTLAVVGAYAVMSLVTFAMYGVDKRRAGRGRWRIRESHLHLLELFFGWPGAIAGQAFFRHKLRKLSYMAVFVLIVAMHITVWMLWYRR